MLSPPSITAIVVNWNGQAYLDKCLSSLLSQTCRPHHIILVDNGSTDGSVEHVRTRYPDVHIIALSRNIGFAAANNIAIRQSSGAYVALLNNDAFAEPGWLAALAEAMESDKQVGMCASKMLFAHRPEILNSTGICVDRLGIAWDRCGGQPDDEREIRPVKVFGPCAGAALYRRAMLDEIGLFDEDFFAYLEDVDLAWRAQRAGWRCLYVPAARVFHHHSATGVEGSSFKSFYLGRNKVWLILKNYPLPAGLLYLPLALLYDLGTLPYRHFLRGDWSALQGRWEGLKNWRIAWRKRCEGGEPRRWPPGMSPPASLRQVHARVRHVAHHSSPCIP